MTQTAKVALSLERLSSHERHALSLIAIQDSAGRVTPLGSLEPVFGSQKEAQVRLDGLVSLGFLRRARGGFRPSEAALQEMERVASQERARQEALFVAYQPLQQQNPGYFLALRGGELFDRDTDFKKLIERIAPVRVSERLTIVPPLRP